MTRLWYGEIKRWRVERYREFDRLMNAYDSNSSRITAGSTGDGLAFTKAIRTF
ncbi:hypothetical protein DPMN_086020 [Dreissena polymorpha]|uniref:Uncharacterized protein n=1 Tax=Dreissena polymorpha TaxID=45954 RepID=A0A9D4BMH9_DREPO|nr:hypothetical protein DPMN_086020 [Dreissena polymorpha]